MASYKGFRMIFGVAAILSLMAFQAHAVYVPTGAASHSSTPKEPGAIVPAEAMVKCEPAHRNGDMRIIVGCEYRAGWSPSTWRNVTFKAYAEWALGRKIEVVGISYYSPSSDMYIYVRYVEGK
jgi:hypothetical protein